MFDVFFESYSEVFGADCTLSDEELRNLIAGHPNLGSEFVKVRGEEEMVSFLMKHMPELLKYVSEKRSSASKDFSCFPVFRTAYVEAYGQDCNLPAGELWAAMCKHATLGEMLHGLRFSHEDTDAFILDHLQEFLAHIRDLCYCWNGNTAG